MAERVQNFGVVDEIAAQAGVETAPPLSLSSILQPVVFGPQRPPQASSGYFPGCVGFEDAAVALNTTQAGLAVTGALAASVVIVNGIVIKNNSGGVLTYSIRRLDDIAGFTLLDLVPGYIDAGNPLSGGVARCDRSDTVAAQGIRMAQVELEDNEQFHFPGKWVLNNGALTVTCDTVNKPVRMYMYFEHWPSIRRQPTGG